MTVEYIERTTRLFTVFPRRAKIRFRFTTRIVLNHWEMVKILIRQLQVSGVRVFAVIKRLGRFFIMFRLFYRAERAMSLSWRRVRRMQPAGRCHRRSRLLPATFRRSFYCATRLSLFNNTALQAGFEASLWTFFTPPLSVLKKRSRDISQF